MNETSPSEQQRLRIRQTIERFIDLIAERIARTLLSERACSKPSGQKENSSSNSSGD